MKLGAVAKKIKREHVACLKAMRKALEHAKTAGELLIEAKTKLPHGDYERWVRENCGISTVTAWRYVQVAENWSNLSRVKDLAETSLRQALAFLAAGADHHPETATSWSVGGEWQDDLPLRTIHREFTSFLSSGRWRDYDAQNKAELLSELQTVEKLIARIKTELAGEDVAKSEESTGRGRTIRLAS